MGSSSRLKRAKDACFSGAGIRVTVLDCTGPGGPLDKLQEQELDGFLKKLRGRNKAGKKEAAALVSPGTPLAALPACHGRVMTGR